MTLSILLLPLLSEVKTPLLPPEELLDKFITKVETFEGAGIPFES